MTIANVINNNVNTAVEGTYSVTYQVTSLINGKVTTKTIVVKVKTQCSRCQVITDLIESVALEQTALLHIINAEGEKIQKILSIDARPETLLLVNQLVESTINSVSRLEVILQSKLAKLDECTCSEEC